MEVQTLSNNNSNQFFIILRVLIGFTLLLPFDINPFIKLVISQLRNKMDNIQLLRQNNLVLENAKLILATGLLLPFDLEQLINGLPVPDAPIGVQLLIQLFKLMFNNLYQIGIKIELQIIFRYNKIQPYQEKTIMLRSIFFYVYTYIVQPLFIFILVAPLNLGALMDGKFLKDWPVFVKLLLNLYNWALPYFQQINNVRF